MSNIASDLCPHSNLPACAQHRERPGSRLDWSPESMSTTVTHPADSLITYSFPLCFGGDMLFLEPSENTLCTDPLLKLSSLSSYYYSFLEFLHGSSHVFFIRVEGPWGQESSLVSLQHNPQNAIAPFYQLASKLIILPGQCTCSLNNGWWNQLMNNWHLFYSQPPPPLGILCLYHSKADVSEIDFTVRSFYKYSNFELKHRRGLYNNNDS